MKIACWKCQTIIYIYFLYSVRYISVVIRKCRTQSALERLGSKSAGLGIKAGPVIKASASKGRAGNKGGPGYIANAVPAVV